MTKFVRVKVNHTKKYFKWRRNSVAAETKQKKMSRKTSWPLNRGMFRTPFQAEFDRQRSPSPIVEMPMSPDPELSNGRCSMSPPPQPLRISTSIERSLSPRRSMSPFSSSIIREIPIEVQQEVCVIVWCDNPENSSCDRTKTHFSYSNHGDIEFDDSLFPFAFSSIDIPSEWNHSTLFA